MEYYGCNILGDMHVYHSHDMHCPLIGTKGNNYWESKCKARQRDPEQKQTCYPYCKAERNIAKIEASKINGAKSSDAPKKARTASMRSEMVRLAKSGFTIEQISIAMNVPRGKISDHLRIARRYGELPKIHHDKRDNNGRFTKEN